MGSDEREAKVEALKQDDDIRRELEQASPDIQPKKPVVETKHKFWLLTYLLALIGFGVIYYLLSLDFFVIGWLGGKKEVEGSYIPLLQRLSLGAMAVALVMLSSRLIKAYLIEQLEDYAARYNLRRIVNLLGWLTVFFILISVLFANWYTAFVSFGLISLILGFALQTPITSLIGWIYILVKVPYKVGDRIKIGEATGDVINVNYLDTILWEFGGQHLSTDHPSGRIIKFPNSNVLSSSVYNYSWSLFPYIWNDIKFQVAYQSDLEFVARTMREAAAEEVGEAMMERIRTFRELLTHTPIDQLEVQEYPTVVFRVGDNTWIEAICRYLVEPRRAGHVKTRLIKVMLERLNKEPEKVMFPKGDMR
jgi:small-conductance mechanosensitive channel